MIQIPLLGKLAGAGATLGRGALGAARGAFSGARAASGAGAAGEAAATGAGAAGAVGAAGAAAIGAEAAGLGTGGLRFIQFLTTLGAPLETIKKLQRLALRGDVMGWNKAQNETISLIRTNPMKFKKLKTLSDRAKAGKWGSQERLTKGIDRVALAARELGATASEELISTGFGPRLGPPPPAGFIDKAAKLSAAMFVPFMGMEMASWLFGGDEDDEQMDPATMALLAQQMGEGGGGIGGIGGIGGGGGGGGRGQLQDNSDKQLGQALSNATNMIKLSQMMGGGQEAQQQQFNPYMSIG